MTPGELEELCTGLESGRAVCWDGVSPRAVKAVALELLGSLSRLKGIILHALKWQGWSRSSWVRGRTQLNIQVLDQSLFSLFSLNFLRGSNRPDWSSS